MSETVQVDEGRVAYEVSGTGDAVVVALPGIGDTRASYRSLVPRLVAEGFKVYAMDLRGHGDSDTGFSRFMSEDIGDDVVALLEALELRDVTLLGNSVGAAASVHASLRSERVGRIVSLSGFVSDPPKFGLMKLLLGLMFAWPWGVWLWGRYRKTLFATPPSDLERNQAEVLANLREPGRLRALRMMMCSTKAGVAARLGQLKVPTLVAMGAQDPDFPDPSAEAARQAEVLGGENEVVMVDGAGHYPQIEKPEATARAIVDFARGGNPGT